MTLKTKSCFKINHNTPKITNFVSKFWGVNFASQPPSYELKNISLFFNPYHFWYVFVFNFKKRKSPRLIWAPVSISTTFYKFNSFVSPFVWNLRKHLNDKDFELNCILKAMHRPQNITSSVCFTLCSLVTNYYECNICAYN